MSGSSLDGLDLSIINFTNDNYKFVRSETIVFPQNIIELLYNIKKANITEFFMLKNQFSTFLGESIKHFIEKSNTPVDLIASHGHTLFHHPKLGFSVQIGDGAVISTITGIDTLCDFRSQDVALAGEGAPLVPIVESHLLKDYKVFLNLGGIANITYIKSPEDIIAFDVCGCNQVLNHFANKLDLPFDDKGNIARESTLDEELLIFLKKHPYYQKPWPKSLDNQYVYSDFIYPIPDVIPINKILNTYVNFIAGEISDTCKKLNLKNEKILVTGGGAFNHYLLEIIGSKCDEIGIKLEVPSEDLINYKEALLMAYMGYLYSNNEFNTISCATGAKEDWISGALYKGRKK
jgi:anhydro-N-acetylmuramic acid kinase